MIASQLARLVPFDSLASGEVGRIVDVEGPAAVVHRLHELGFHQGEPVRMIRPGPPHLIQIGETRLVFRPEADVLVLVELIAS